MTTRIHESTAATVTAPADAAPGRIRIGLITPGLGSSGYYSEAVLRNAEKDRVWPKGTHVYFDHPSESEQHDRPERSVRDLAAVLSEDATWDGSGLAADADVIGPYRALVTDPVFVSSVGMSIRATAEARAGEVDGKKVVVVTKLLEGLSVDLVTHAGRGGRVLAVLESARESAAADQLAAVEALTQDTRSLLDAAVMAAHAGPGQYAYLRDFDPDTGEAVYGIETETASSLYRDGFTIAPDGLSAALAGSPVEVRQRTEYVPVTSTAAIEGSPHRVPAPAGRTTHPTTSKEDSMGTIQVDEAEHARVTEAAGRVAEAEAAAAAAIARATTAEAELAAGRRTTAATAVIEAQATEAGVTFTALERRGLLADAAVTDAGELDTEAFTAAVRLAATTKAAESGASGGTGRPHGLGLTESITHAADAPTSWDDVDSILTGKV